MNIKFEKTYRLFLDDIREPKDVPLYISKEDGKKYLLFNWKIVRNYDEFVKYITENGIPSHISFDHDLADEHYTPKEYWDDYNKSKNYQDKKIYKEKTGEDCAIWLRRYLKERNIPLPICYVHSQNPVGADYIKEALGIHNFTHKYTYATENI